MSVNPIFLSSVVGIFINVSAIPPRNLLRTRLIKKYGAGWENQLKQHINSSAELSKTNKHYVHYPHHAHEKYRGIGAMDASMLNALILNMGLLRYDRNMTYNYSVPLTQQQKENLRESQLSGALSNLMITRNKIHEITMTNEEKYEMACSALKGMEKYLELDRDEKQALKDFYMGIDESIANLVVTDEAQLSQANSLISQGAVQEGFNMIKELSDKCYVPAMLRLAQLYRTSYTGSLVDAMQRSLDVLNSAKALGANVDSIIAETSRANELLKKRGTSIEAEEELVALHRQGQFLPRHFSYFEECFKRMEALSGTPWVNYVVREVAEHKNMHVLPIFISYGYEAAIPKLLSTVHADYATEGWKILCNMGHVPAIVEYSERQMKGIGCRANRSAPLLRLKSLYDDFVSRSDIENTFKKYPSEFNRLCDMLAELYFEEYHNSPESEEGLTSLAQAIMICNSWEMAFNSSEAILWLDSFYTAYCDNAISKCEPPRYLHLHTGIYQTLEFLENNSPRKAYWAEKKKEYLSKYWKLCLDMTSSAQTDPEANKKLFEFNDEMVRRGMMDLPLDENTGYGKDYASARNAALRAKHDLEHPEEAKKNAANARNSSILSMLLCPIAAVLMYFAAKYVFKWVLILPLGILDMILTIFDIRILSNFQQVHNFSQAVMMIICCGGPICLFIVSLLGLLGSGKKDK